MNNKFNYNHTIYACYIGYITQAIVNNFVPLLFVTFQNSFDITIEQIAFLVTMNFGIQLIVDALCGKLADKIGYKTSICIAHFFAAIGLIGLAIFPYLFSNAYTGIITAIAIYAIGGGLTEVLISPIVEGCPTEKKSAAMSILHSFYMWGMVFVIIVSTIFFKLVGIENWRLLAILWSLIPAFNMFFFMFVPINKVTDEKETISTRKLLSMKLFWLLSILMICAGAAEQAMSQWASTFAEMGLNISKTAGDVAGPCMMAALAGLARLLYGKFSDKVKLKRLMIISSMGAIVCYILVGSNIHPIISLAGCALCGLFVGILWPGTFSIAAKECVGGGTMLFALLALFGDVGCAAGPAVVGFVSNAVGGNLSRGLLIAIIFPIIMLIGLIMIPKSNKRKIVK